ncbi:MAG: DUF2806 domain-containing protein [Clostridiales bacterium]|nr:DUF2806 domain-containing protein [Clostridiales bacterium]
MSNIIEQIGNSVNAVEKLFYTVQAALGKLYEPTHVRKMADANAYEIQKIGEAMRENCDIPIEYKNDAVAMSTGDADEFVKRTQHRMAYQELTKQINIESVVGQTYSILENEKDVTDEPVSDDFMNCFYNCVQDVSTEEMQKLWAKILAGEVKQPSTFSLRTLSVLHNMTKQEAEKFQKMLSYIIRFEDGAFLPNYSRLLNSVGISYSDILDAEEWGLIKSSPSIEASIRFSTNDGVVCRNKKYMITMESTQTARGELHVPQYPLTVAGREIAALP